MSFNRARATKALNTPITAASRVMGTTCQVVVKSPRRCARSVDRSPSDHDFALCAVIIRELVKQRGSYVSDPLPPSSSGADRYQDASLRLHEVPRPRPGPYRATHSYDARSARSGCALREAKAAHKL